MSGREQTPRPLTFVVGTGRTGSTALTRILHLHPSVLSLSELTTAIRHRGFPEGLLTGDQFWRILADPNQLLDAMTRSGVPAPEFCYLDLPAGAARFSVDGGGIPAISLMTLPRLTTDPDGLYDRLRTTIARRPVQTTAAHHLDLHRTLCEWLRRDIVVERSGGSLSAVPLLKELFPHARFVHMYRYGPECALSMSRNPLFRALLLLKEVFDHLGFRDFSDLEKITVSELLALPPHLIDLLSDRFDPGLIADLDAPLTRFGELWSTMTAEGLAHLNELPPEQWTSLSYERLLDDPEGELSRLASFIGADPRPEWLAAGRSLLSHRYRNATGTLTASDRADLRDACAAGLAALNAPD